MQNKLRERREQLNMTQKQVAAAVGIAESQYQRYEYGRQPLVVVANKIASALNTTALELWGTDDCGRSIN